MDDYRSVRKSLMDSMDDLSNSEKKVARSLLAQYPAAGLNTVASLAEAAGVSAPTVVRFVAKLGYAGYPAFQRALIHEVNAEMGSPVRQFSTKAMEPTSGALTRTQHAFADMIELTYDEVPQSEFDRVVELLSKSAAEVWVVGGRFSRLLAEYLVLHLRLLRPRVNMTLPDAMGHSTTLADLTSSSVVVIFDYRRYDESLAAFAEAAAERGATVCLMTDNWLSPAAQSAKVVLPCRVESASPFDSLVAAMALTESVITGVTERLGETGLKRLQDLEGDH